MVGNSALQYVNFRMPSVFNLYGKKKHIRLAANGVSHIEWKAV